jgi:murein DD-endopeptidase MepM/ murein hydrolase activator NlpD
MRPVSLLADYPKRRWTRSRSIAVGRRTIIAAVTGLAVLASWSAASVWYFVSRDEVALRLLEGQAAQKRLYEDRLAALRAKLEQVSSQRLVEHEVLESQLKALLARQAALESRQAQVDTLAADRTGSIEPKIAPGRPVEAGAGPSRPTLVPDFFQLRLGPADAVPNERQSQLHDFRRDLDRASSALASLEAEQMKTLQSVADEAELHGRKLQNAIRRAGLDPSTFEPAAANSGGPFVPAQEAKPFEAVLQQAQVSLTRLQHLRRSVTALPFGEPINSEIDLSSGFGIRVDPFTRSPAMHTGLDFRAEYGAAVRAAGAGRVIAAEASGAYGNMVEVEHAGGVTSRYAHLSTIAVAVGQEVKAGTVVGRVGSTGRSTGPHLHYETRLNGDAVDPQRFLKAGASIVPMTSR